MRKSEVLELVREHKTMFVRGFVPWVVENFHLFEEFSRRADSLWSSGKRRYSSRTIGEVIRFDRDVSGSSQDKFKLNNNFTPDMGRVYVLLHPERVDLFEYRREQNKIKQAAGGLSA